MRVYRDCQLKIIDIVDVNVDCFVTAAIALVSAENPDVYCVHGFKIKTSVDLQRVDEVGEDAVVHVIKPGEKDLGDGAAGILIAASDAGDYPAVGHLGRLLHLFGARRLLQPLSPPPDRGGSSRP